MYDVETVLEDLPLRIPETRRATTPTRPLHHAGAGNADQNLDVFIAHDIADLTFAASKVRETSFHVNRDMQRTASKLFELQSRNILLTELRDHWVIINQLTAPMTSTPELSQWETSVETALSRSKNRLAYLLSLPDGWLGEGSRAPLREAAERASDLLAQINSVAPDALPDLSLDEDGTIVMSWDDGGLAGSLSVYADGRYAYFIERDGGGWASDSMASVEAGIASKLSEILAA